MTTPTDDAAGPRQLTDDNNSRRRELVSGAQEMAPLMVGYLPFGLLLGAAIARSSEVWAAWSGTVPIYGGSARSPC